MTMRRGRARRLACHPTLPRSSAARIMARTFPNVIALPPASRLSGNAPSFTARHGLRVGAFGPLIALLAFTVGPGAVKRPTRQ